MLGVVLVAAGGAAVGTGRLGGRHAATDGRSSRDEARWEGRRTDSSTSIEHHPVGHPTFLQSSESTDSSPPATGTSAAVASPKALAVAELAALAGTTLVAILLRC